MGMHHFADALANVRYADINEVFEGTSRWFTDPDIDLPDFVCELYEGHGLHDALSEELFPAIPDEGTIRFEHKDNVYTITGSIAGVTLSRAPNGYAHSIPQDSAVQGRHQ